MATSDKSVDVNHATSNSPAVQYLPGGVAKSGLLSPTSVAADCYVYQRFSNKLQVYLVAYVSQVAGEHPIPYA